MKTRRLFAALLLFSAYCPAQEALTFRGNAGDAVLLHHQIDFNQLPGPEATPSADRPSRVVPHPDDAVLHLPQGFEITVFADGLDTPRWLAQAPNGDVFVAESRASRVDILRDPKGTGHATERYVFAEGLKQPFGMAFHGDYLYVGDTDAVVRMRYRAGQVRSEGKPEQVIGLPGEGYRQHWTRNLLFSRDGSKLYVTIGSQSNDTPEPDPRRAAINQYNADGSGHRLFATGLRNPVGLAFYPGTDTLWTTVNERDGMGEDLPPDYVTSVQDGGFYGWPYAYLGPHSDPAHGGERDDLVKKTMAPDVLIQAHSAVLGLAFYQGSMFPDEYRGDAFVALHGSWNRAQLTGYKIIRIRFKDRKPIGGYEDFITGWSPSPEDRRVWGRPVGLLVLADGSLLIADDGGDRIWRVTYRK